MIFYARNIISYYDILHNGIKVNLKVTWNYCKKVLRRLTSGANVRNIKACCLIISLTMGGI